MRLPSYTAILATALALAAPAAAHPPFEKMMRIAPQPGPTVFSVRLAVSPGSTAGWRSPRLPGPISRVSLVAGGLPMAYELRPRTNGCVGYAYGGGVALRLTDCRHGRRARFVWAKAVSASPFPVRLVLRFWASPTPPRGSAESLSAAP